MESRKLAIEWWRALRWNEKGLLIEGFFKHRRQKSLTGREIEEIWKQETQQP